MRLRLLPLVALLVCGLVVLVVVTRQPPDGPANRSTPAEGVSPSSVAELGPVGRYVALGDSFTAGPLIPWVRSEPAACLRSSRNYPALLAEWLGARRMRDVSCSGADTTDLATPQQALGAPVPSQFDALTPGTDLVTLGIGGNDFGVFARLISGDRPSGLAATLARTGDRVAAALAEIRVHAPDAVIALVGYPRILPAVGSCPELPFSGDDYRFLNRVERALNSELLLAAAEHDALYVDTYAASLGHDACAGDDAWVNGEDTEPLQALAYHPFQAGMAATATAVHLALEGVEPTRVVRRDARTALAERPAHSLSRPAQRVVAALLGG